MKTKPIPAPDNWQDLRPHPLSALVEFGVGIDVDALADHMRRHGYDPDESVVVHEGQILDGRHKHAAAIKADITPTFREFAGKNAMAYAGKKLFRQHLTESQRAMMAATLTKVIPTSDVATSANLPNKPPSQSQAAAALKVSTRSVGEAVKVQEKGTEALNGAVHDGTLAVSDAARVAGEPADVQDAAVASVRGGKARTASGAAGKKGLCERCLRVGAVKDCPMCAEARKAKTPAKKASAPEAADAPVDAFKNPLPKRCRDAYCDPWVQDAYDLFCELSEKMRNARVGDGMRKRAKRLPFFVEKDVIDGANFVVQYLDSLIDHFRTSRPAGVCPSCGGAGCGDCRTSGLVPRELYQRLTKAAKEGAAK